jgi:hypothetical protein
MDIVAGVMLIFLAWMIIFCGLITRARRLKKMHSTNLLMYHMERLAIENPDADIEKRIKRLFACA